MPLNEKEFINKFENDPDFIDRFKKVVKDSTFKSDFFSGKVSFGDIVRYISDWEKDHKGETLPDYLGMTFDEYQEYEKGTLEKKWEKDLKSTASIKKALSKVLKK